jgi:Tol biopolymer transport system component
MPLPLKVHKTHLVNSRNERVRLRGVNTASLEWSSDGEGHTLDTVKVAIKDWRVNVIRLPLSQDRWFGKAPEQKDEGKAYRALVKQVVDTCAGRNCYIMLDLHWSDAGVWGKNIGQRVMPDRNSLVFWKDLALAYKNHPAVLFDLYNEPHDVSWDVWLKGGKVTERDRRARRELTFEAVGMQALLDAVRATGAKNVVVAGGLDWAYDMSGFLAGKQLSDPRGNGVLYANHTYPFKGDTVQQWVKKLEAAAKKIPVIVGEFGPEVRGPVSKRGEQWVRQVLRALHEHDWDWVAWDMHPKAGPCLISDWKYTPTPGFGALVKDALGGKYPSRERPAAPPKPARSTAARVGIFKGSGDVGEVLHPGSTKYDEAARAYTVAGSGANMWSTRDAFHFAWKKLSGDLALAADVSFLGAGKDPHRKACLMIRQSLDADSAYVDVAVHGDGLTSLQFRHARGAATHEVQANVSALARVQLVRRGQYALLYLAARGEQLRFSGAAVRVAFDGPVHAGIGVCAHNKDVTERAVFSNVELKTTFPASKDRPVLYSTLETQVMASTDRRVVHVSPTRIEAPNWLRDGKTLIYNSGGRLYRIPVAGGKPEVIDTGFATRCNNDHGVSPDGTQLVISDQSQGKGKSLIYTLPVTGGKPKLVTPAGPSYWHGWSPDGKTLAFCGGRNDKFDIYTIPAAGGPEKRLTTARGLNDGPEFSPDGKHIYFNSDRTGRMHIWRMKIDGTEQERITDDDYNNWFPHPSPDGRTLVFLSYEKDVTGHPQNKDVTLRRMTLKDKKIDVLGRFFGGQGTINVPCWSPDGRRIAFVTYQLIR